MIKNKFKNFLILSLILILLFSFPKKVKADFFGVFDYFESAEGGIEEQTKPLMQRIFLILFTAIIGVFLLWISSSLLDWVISHPEWLSLKNPIVQSGLYFTTGLVNLFIILLFVAIAIAWILKIETFVAKKALPKLILVALLVNFVPIFVGIPIDIATIIHKTILTDKDLVPKSIEAIFGGMDQLITGMVSWMIALSVLLIIPFVSPFAEYGFVIFILTLPLFGPILLSWLIQIILAILLSIIYFTLAFLFAARIYVIWFLTIAAPLAFLCLVLPQTEKYWKEWLQHLLDWVFFGLIVLLFLVVGLKGIKHIAPQNFYGLPPNTPGLMWLFLPSYFSYYFFLFVFISIISFLSKRFSPQLANFLIAQGTALTGMFMGGAAVLGKGLASSLRQSLAQQRATEERAREKQKRGEKLTRAERLALARPVSGLRRFGGWAHYQITGKTVEEVEAGRIRKLEEEAMKIETTDEFRRKIKEVKRSGSLSTQTAFVAAGTKKGKKFKEIVREEIPETRARDLMNAANRLGRRKDAETIARAYYDKLTEEDLRRAGFELTPEDTRRGYTSVKQKLIAESKGDEIKEFAKEFWKDPAAMEAIQKFWGGPQIRKAAEEFTREFVADYMKAVHEKGPVWYAANNPRAALFLATTGAQELGLSSPRGFSAKEIRELIELIRRYKEVGAEDRIERLEKEPEEEIRRLLREWRARRGETEKRERGSMPPFE
jgi:hypothetical protein